MEYESDSSHTENSNSDNILDFKAAVTEWIRINEEISRLQKESRTKKHRMNHLGIFITTFMKNNKKEFCSIGEESALVLKSRKSTTGLKKENVLKVLESYIRNEDKAKECITAIYNTRITKEKDIIQMKTL